MTTQHPKSCGYYAVFATTTKPNQLKFKLTDKSFCRISSHLFHFWEGQGTLAGVEAGMRPHPRDHPELHFPCLLSSAVQITPADGRSHKSLPT